MRHLLLAAGIGLSSLAGAAALPTQAAVVQSPSPAAALDALLVDYEAYLRQNDPIGSGMDGDRAALWRLPDASHAGELARRAPLNALKARLAAIDPATLDEAHRLNHAFVSYLIGRELERIELDPSRLAFDSEGGPGQMLAYVAPATRIATAADAEAWLKRLEAAPAFYDAGIANTRRGLETGLIQ